MIGKRINVLLIDDDETDYLIVYHHLLQAYRTCYSVDWVSSYEEAIELIEKKDYDVFLIDYFLTGETGLEFIKSTNLKEKNTPIIMVTGSSCLETDNKALELGISDFLDKNKLDEQILDRSIRYAIEQKKLLNEVTQAQQQRHLLSATLTHDLRTPIQAELKILEHLSRGTYGDINPKQQAVFKELIKSNRYLYHMINNLLKTFQFENKKAELNLVISNLNHIIESVVLGHLQVLAEEKKQSLILQLDPALPSTPIDSLEIQRVIYNLVQNAITYSNTEQAITITTKTLDNSIYFSVTDTGIGISEDNQSLLFQPYSSIKVYKTVGTGLGLYLSKHIIDAHGGQIALTSRLGHGSCFSFELPLTTETDTDLVITNEMAQHT